MSGWRIFWQDRSDPVVFGRALYIHTPWGILKFKSPGADALFSERYGHEKTLLSAFGYRCLWRGRRVA